MSERMPAVFIGHGSPTNALEDNATTRAWSELARKLPRPGAILAISGHFYTHGTAVTAMEHPPTVHDFYGFPKPMYEIRYPAPGSPQLAQRVADLLAPEPVVLDTKEWGLDHGTWSVLLHMYPQADIPVVQLSMDGHKSFAQHYELARRLQPLRDEGVLILGTGQIVHNLRMMDFNLPDKAYDWAVRFEEAVHEAMTRAPQSVPALERHPDYRLASPTPDHFLPLVYVAALAGPEAPARAVLREVSLGGSSLSSYVVGA